MINLAIEKNPKGLEVYYYDDTHQYILQNPKKKLISGTTFIKAFFEPFDTEKISFFCAKKRGITQQEIKDEWKENSKIASDHGTRVHNFIEQYLKYGITQRSLTEKERNCNNNILKFMNSILEKYEIVYSEKIIFDEIIAGTLDLLLRSRANPRKYLLADFKTNKDLNIENKYNNYGLYPITHIEDTNFGHYTLQLSLYQYLLLKEGYLIDIESIERSIFHISEDNVLEYKVDFLEKEIIDMCEFFLKK